MKKIAYSIICFIALIMIVTVLLVSKKTPKTPDFNKKVKVGVIDTCVSGKCILDYKLENVFHLCPGQVVTEVTHGEKMLDIIYGNCKKNIVIYYAEALSDDNTSIIENICSSIDYMIENKVSVINISSSTLVDSPKLNSAICRAQELGIVIITSCINYSDAICYPACYAGVISVSNCENNNASVCFNEEEKASIASHVPDFSTSSLTAYYTAQYVNNMQDKEE